MDFRPRSRELPKTPRGLTPERAPATVLATVARLGRNIAAARRNRRWRQEDLAARAGVDRRTILGIEQGKPGIAVGAYVAALWAMGLEGQVASVAGPGRDPEGETLAAARAGRRMRPAAEPDDEF